MNNYCKYGDIFTNKYIITHASWKINKDIYFQVVNVEKKLSYNYKQ